MTNVRSCSVPSTLMSQLVIDDPEMIDVVTEFVGDLPARIAEMQNAHRELDWELLRTCAHRLKGTGGSYGYPMLSEIAALLERGFVERRDDQFSDLVSQLQRLAEAAEAGLRESA